MQPPSPPFHPHRIVAQLLIIALLLITVATLATARVAAQEPGYRLASGDLGVTPDLMTADTTVHSPYGAFAGPDGVAAFVDSLRKAYPGARFDTGETHVVGGLLIVDWHGTIDGDVVASGRTLITIDDGRVTRLSFLDLSTNAPVDDEPFPIA